MKDLAKRIIFNKTMGKLLLKPILRLHTQCYKWAGRYAVVLNDGVHPKHHILRYKEWFRDNIEQGWSVLDVGCNTGILPFMLAEKAGFVYGIEINKNHISTARSQHSSNNIEYICADATTYNYSHCRPIDCITLSNVLEHIEQRDVFFKKLISQLNWADENHKRFLIRVPMIERGWIVLYKKQLGLDSRLDHSHYTEYTLEQLKEELKQAGIVTKQVKIQFGEIYAICEAV